MTIHVIAETAETVTVTLSRADYRALLNAVDDTEDSADVAALRVAEAAVAAGQDEYLPVRMVERLLSGESPVRVWRDHRRLTGRALAEAAGIAPAYLSEIETGKKPGSFDAMTRIAKALGLSLDDLVPARDE